MEIDWALDSPWETSPGLHRGWVITEDTIAKQEALPERLGRKVVRQFVDGPLLERHLSGHIADGLRSKTFQSAGSKTNGARHSSHDLE